ncbi:MAG: hypothetical protein A2284_10495 [Deltaproteobacteria bacterium RIFOXYA12_FULL_61_11]|nr:MAG: hypothetical protein A2284_10495 [Deltaproteobacteria bacterium RIFOXYA12_FULL_61_11]
MVSRSTPLSGRCGIELLAPARDLPCGLAAIDSGADAVYVGAPRFGARARVGNELRAIADLCAYAHRFWVKVYATVNTLLRDSELDEAVRLCRELAELGVDGLILQDLGLLRRELPDLPLIASTQLDNSTPAKVRFLEQVGFSRVILGRELSLDELRSIREASAIELECFVHGSLCVGQSGRCHLSLARGGRSGNRGECAQPCRQRYRLLDGEGRELAGGHLLSLRDLDLSAQLGTLLDLGITSFKIEGRLKDEVYVRDVVGAYRLRLDEELTPRGLRKTSSGTTRLGFEPRPECGFNRGTTTYFLLGRSSSIAEHRTPAMLGEELGVVRALRGRTIELSGEVQLTAGDGVCWFDRDNLLHGASVLAVHGARTTLERVEGLELGDRVWRNRDQAHRKAVLAGRSVRSIEVRFSLLVEPGALLLCATDEDGLTVEKRLAYAWAAADHPSDAAATLERQLRRTGSSGFSCSECQVVSAVMPFLPVSILNGLRRAALEDLLALRLRARPRTGRAPCEATARSPLATVGYEDNVLNREAEAFYRFHGAEVVEWAPEAGGSLQGSRVMRTRYCVLEELGRCRRRSPELAPLGPLTLVDERGRSLRLELTCGDCGMDLVELGLLTPAGSDAPGGEDR